MLKKAVLVAAAGSLLAAVSDPLLAAEEQSAEIRPVEALAVAPDATWDGQQYVAADAKGRVFLFRGETFEVFPVEKVTRLGEPTALKTIGLDNPGPILDAAMDRHGDWAVLQGSEVRWFRSGKEKALPRLGWIPGSVELLDGRPVVMVFPFPMGHGSREKVKRTPPMVIALDGDDWAALVDSPYRRVPRDEGYVPVRQREAAHTLVDSEDTLWLANRYRYRIAHYSAAGRELLSLELDEAEIRHRDELDVEDRRILLEEERARYAEPARASITTNTAVSVILAIAEGRDGRIYLLVKGRDENLWLDRFDTVRGVVESTPTTATAPGAVSMVGGADGLYVVPYNGRRSRFLIRWEDLEEAQWLPVEGIEMNGLQTEIASDD